jgi:gliding motility-associated-like protein
LLDSDACQDPCPDPLTASFDASNISILAGGTVNFNNTSTNTNNWDWQIDGLSFANSQNANYTFNTIGNFDITLVAANSTPNCFDDYTITIEVLCNTVADFTASAGIVEVGQSVSFTNSSTGANTYEWFLDGTAQSTAVDFTNSFLATGVYTICLEATGDICTDEICFGLVVNNIATDCEQTFIKTFGTTNADEKGYTLCSSEDGNLYLASSRQDSALLIKFTPEGDRIWERTFLFNSTGVNIISDLNLDSDNQLVGCGFGNGGALNRIGFAFRYDPVADNFHWIQNHQPGTSSLTNADINEINPGGNYLLTGQLNSGNSFGCDGSLFELDRNTGAISNLNERYHIGSCETFQSAQIYNGDLYVSGRYNFAGGGTNKMRGAVSRFDLSGTEIWTRLYLVDVADNARLYAPGMLVENDEIVVVQQGDKNGTSATNPEVFLTKSNLDGNFMWAKNYGGTADFQTGSSGVELLLDDVYLYFTGWTSNLGGGDEDILLGKVNLLDGTINDACLFVEDLTFNVSDFPNPYEGVHSLSPFQNNITSTHPVVSSTISPLTEATLCSSSCNEICDNGIDDDLDGYVDCYDSTCDCEIDNCVITELETNFAVRLAWESQVDLAAVDATPIVANLNPQVDDIPEIICGISTSGITNSTSNRLLIFRGDGLNNVAPKELLIQNNYDMYPDAKPVVGDVNADGIPELLIISTDRRIRVYSNYSETSTNVMDQIAVSTQTVANRDYVAYLADFDQDGISEVYCGNEVFKFDFSGPTVTLNRVLLGTGSIGRLARKNYEFNSCSPVAAELLSQSDCAGDPDCNGLEIAAGNMIYSIDMDPNDGDGLEIKIQRDLNVLQNQYNYRDGYTVVADMNLDGVMDVVVAARRDQKYGLYVWDKNGVIEFFPKPVSDIDDLFGALPCVANVYDDTQNGAAEDWPEIIITSRYELLCWNLNAAQLTPATPAWWDLPTTDASGLTGVTVFDFNGDGTQEIVYRDEDNLRIMYGGNVPFPTGVDANRNWETFVAGSGTFDEHPVVADIDNDKQAEIIVTSYIVAGTNNPAADYRGRLRVFESDPQAGGPWLSARNIWNQYNYHVVNVNDDLSIPLEQQQHHLEFPEPGSGYRPFNNFLAQAPILNDDYIPYLPLPDATVEVIDLECGVDSFSITLMICNVGDALLPIGTPVAFYEDDPQNGAAVLHSIDLTSVEVLPTSCTNITFTIINSLATTLHLIVNDNNTLPTPYSLLDDFPSTSILECDYTNNISFFDLESNPLSLDLGPDIILCENGVVALDAGQGFDSYSWQNGETSSAFTAYEPGTYWVEVSGACETLLSDTITITLDNTTVADLGPDTVLCDGGSITFSLSGFDEYQWYPVTDLDCSDCGMVTANPVSSQTYTVVASTNAGCISVDSVTITIGAITMTSVDTVICDGDIFDYNGTMIPTDSTMTFDFVTVEGCDSTVAVTVIASPFSSSLVEIDTAICEGTTVFLENTNLSPNNSFTFDYFTIAGCDSTIIINVLQLDTALIQEIILICAGDSALVFGQYENAAGTYSNTYTAFNTCDSIYEITLSILAELQYEAAIMPTCPDEQTGSIDILVNGGLAPYNFDWGFSSDDTNYQSNLSEGLYDLTISDANDCFLATSIEVLSIEEITVGTEIIDPTCFGYSDGQLMIDSSFLGWSFSLDGLNFQEGLSFGSLAPGSYTLSIQNTEDCTFSQELILTNPVELVVQLPRDTTLQLGCPIEIKAFVNTFDSLSYSWSPGTYLDCTDCPVVNALPWYTTTYAVNVIDANDCQATDTINITIEKPRQVYIPNAFSPNGDGQNDRFQIYAGKEVESILYFRIYDRWGELVFEKVNFPPNDPVYGWDGSFKRKNMNNSVFVYIAELQFLDGVRTLYKGDVTIMK